MAPLANIGTLIALLVFTTNNYGVFACSGGGGSAGSGDSGCKYSEFECNDNSACYTDDQKCDGTDHCDDKSDEDSHHCGMVL